MLRRYTGRWQAGIVTVVAARPAMGKSSLLLATADACSAAGFGARIVMGFSSSHYQPRSIRGSIPSAYALRLRLTVADLKELFASLSVNTLIGAAMGFYFGRFTK
jgi:hypothetical protein